MSRPTKQGIDYFPLDCQFDDKIELLIVEKGGVALAIIITIFQLIYQNEGYYIKNGKNLLLLIKRRVGFDLPLIEDIITAAIDQEIFNKKLHKKHNILTSNGIQKRYFTAARLKKKIKIIKNYLLADVSNVGNAIYIGIKSVGNATNVEGEGEVKEEGEVKGEVKEEVKVKKKEGIAQFKKPSFEEIAEYIKKMNYDVDANLIFNHYESNGWKVGKNKMVDWKAAIRSWESRNKKDIKEINQDERAF